MVRERCRGPRTTAGAAGPRGGRLRLRRAASESAGRKDGGEQGKEEMGRRGEEQCGQRRLEAFVRGLGVSR